MNDTVNILCFSQNIKNIFYRETVTELKANLQGSIITILALFLFFDVVQQIIGFAIKY